jgi:tetratricopeptide (TPR) repeat protein
LGKHKDAVVACSEVLRIDPRNVKALYRKAVALAEPAGSDLDDYKVAIKLLVQAVEIDPANTEVRSKLSEYREFLKAQQVKSKETFHSFFKKPLGLEDTKENPQHPPNSQVNETDQYILTQTLGTREETHSGTQGGKPLIRSPCTSVKAKRSQELEERTPNPTVETRLPETLG